MSYSAETTHHKSLVEVFEIISGMDPKKEFNFKLGEEIESIPGITFLCDCEGAIKPEHLRELAEFHHYSDMPSQKVSVTIDEKYVWLSLPVENFSWHTTYKPEEVVESRRVEADQMHAADFIMHHSKVLMKAAHMASKLALRPLVSVLSEPHQRVMIRFCLEEVELVFFFEATSVVKKSLF
ncbi:uncharacterized protein LOC110735073 [Chenopodium quinoa]|uniref:uncharacterized protein LOC110735073 n=1 Tax=Chenopodium quinoa TaxID=63459 RepID=UPI000B78A594|nr:uncharacterized protein LOC110735073 [Chenopodium quinoa]